MKKQNIDSDQVNKHLLGQILRTKSLYRESAAVLTWEQKVASIEKMRDTFVEARKAMRQAHGNKYKSKGSIK
jgi:hypothetical protein